MSRCFWGVVGGGKGRAGILDRKLLQQTELNRQ